MDDVSVSDGINELLSNGGFETGSFSPSWTKSTPNGVCGIFTTGAEIDTSSCRSGSYCFSDGCGAKSDQISQSFMVTSGKTYFISFWLKQTGVGLHTYVTILLS